MGGGSLEMPDFLLLRHCNNFHFAHASMMTTIDNKIISSLNRIGIFKCIQQVATLSLIYLIINPGIITNLVKMVTWGVLLHSCTTRPVFGSVRANSG